MLKLKIVSPERIVFNGEVESVTVPGTAGEFEILGITEDVTVSIDANYAPRERRFRIRSKE